MTRLNLNNAESTVSSWRANLPPCVPRLFGAPMVFSQPRAFALLAVFVVHHAPLVERKRAMVAALHDAGVEEAQVHWVERFDADSRMAALRRCFFDPTKTRGHGGYTHSVVLKHLWAYWQAAHAPTGTVLLLEDDISVLHPMFRTRLRRVFSQLEELKLRSHAVQVVHSGGASFHVSVAIRCGREPWRFACTGRAQCEASPGLSLPFLLKRDIGTLSKWMRVNASHAALEWAARGIANLLSVRPTRAEPPPDWEFEQGGMLVSAEGARALLALHPRDEPRVQSQELHGELWSAAHRGAVSLMLSRPALCMPNLTFGQASWDAAPSGEGSPTHGETPYLLPPKPNGPGAVAWRCCCDAWLPRSTRQ